MDYPKLYKWTQSNHLSPSKEEFFHWSEKYMWQKQEAEEEVREIQSIRTQTIVADIENGGKGP